MRGATVMLRRLIGGRSPRLATASSSFSENFILTSTVTASCSTLLFAEEQMLISPFAPALAANFHSSPVFSFRNYSSSSSSGSGNMVSIESEEQFNESLRKVQDESLPAIFYFTAVWCGPCKLLSPVIGQLSEQYPHVTTYKVDIDKGDISQALSKLDIHSVPTLHFFQDGKKCGEVIGADVQRLKDTMASLYK